MAERAVGEKQLFDLEFSRRENQSRRANHSGDNLPCELLRDADPRAVEEGVRAFHIDFPLSDDPLRGCKYLFAASTALYCRCCIEGGLEEQRAHDIQNLYIRKMDALETEQQVIELHRELLEFYLEEVTAAKKQKICSRPVAACMDYINDHLYEQIRLAGLASHVELNESYLSVLFKKETGVSVSDYVRQRKVEAAEKMLRYSDYSCSDIGNYLAFCSQSHFISVFRRATGLTPRQYRARYAQLTAPE